MPATKLYHIMYLSHHCSLPWVWWTCLYIHKGGTERARLPPLQLPPCVPSSLYCNSSLPRPLLPLFWCPTWVSLAQQRLSCSSELWELNIDQTPHLTLCHPKDRFQHAFHSVLSLCFQKSFFCFSPQGSFPSQLIPLPYSFSNLLQGKRWRHFHVLTTRLANPLIWIPLPCLQGPRHIMVTFILWRTQPPGSSGLFGVWNLFRTLFPLSKQVSFPFIVRAVFVHAKFLSL